MKYLVILKSNKYTDRFRCLMNFNSINFEHLHDDQYCVKMDEKNMRKLKIFEWMAIIKMGS